MKNILIFPCGSEIGLEIYRSLVNEKNLKIFGASSVDDGGRFVFENYIGDVPFIDDEKFIDHIKSIVVEYNIHAIFPSLDVAIPILKKNENFLQTKVISSNYETSLICSSKRKTYQKLVNVIRVPKEYKPNDTFEYPVFLKPEVGSSSRFTYLINDKNEMSVTFPKHNNLMILEYLPGQEYTVDCFSNFKGELKFVSARERTKIINGISVESKIINDDTIVEMAEAINKVLTPNGAWFFQIKKDKNGKYCLLEVASRFGGSSLIQRYRGVNLSLLSLYNIFEEEVEFITNDIDINFYRNLNTKLKTNLNIKNVYVDFDDTIIINNKINTDMIKLLYHFNNSNVNIFLITKHSKNIYTSLDEYKISKELFTNIFQINKNDKKYKYIVNKNSIFIDDSFQERKEVKENCGIPVFSIETIDMLW